MGPWQMSWPLPWRMSWGALKAPSRPTIPDPTQRRHLALALH